MKRPSNRAAEEFSLMSVGMMCAWVLGFFALLAVALILWCRQPDVSPT